MPTHLIIDLIILAVLILAALLGYHRGFILTFCSFLAIFVAFLGAGFLSDLLCQPVGRLIQPALETAIQDLFYQEYNPREIVQFPSAEPEERAAAAPQDGVDADEQTQPLVTLSQILDSMEKNEWMKAMTQSIREQLEEHVTQSANQALHTISNYFAREIARIFLFIVSFLLVMILWWLFSHALDLAFRLPVLSGVNAISGLILGLIKGILLVFIAAWLLKGPFFSQELIHETLLLRFFTENSPISLLLQLLPNR